MDGNNIKTNLSEKDKQKELEFKRSDAREMLKMGVPLSVICKVTGLSRSEVLSS